MRRPFVAMMSVTATAATLHLVAMTNCTRAQSPEPRKAERVADLLARGFEIKAVMPSPTGPRLILQSGPRIYNCDGYELGTDVTPTLPAPSIGMSRTLCFAVKLR